MRWRGWKKFQLSVWSCVYALLIKQRQTIRCLLSVQPPLPIEKASIPRERLFCSGWKPLSHGAEPAGQEAFILRRPNRASFKGEKPSDPGCPSYFTQRPTARSNDFAKEHHRHQKRRHHNLAWDHCLRYITKFRQVKKKKSENTPSQFENKPVEWGVCALRHGIQISMEAILACHPARSTEWLECHPKWCELWRIRTGPISWFLCSRFLCSWILLGPRNLPTLPNGPCVHFRHGTSSSI